MQVNFNPTVSNNKQSVNFGAVNQKWLKKIKFDACEAMNGVGHPVSAFHAKDKQVLTDLRDTFQKGLDDGYVYGENGKRLYKEFIDQLSKQISKL